MAEEYGLELIVGGFRVSERGGEGEKVVVGLEIGLFEKGFERIWTVPFYGHEILFDGFEIGVAS